MNSALPQKAAERHDVVTEFTLSPATNSAGIKYSVVKPKLLGRVSEEARTTVQMFASGIRSAVSGDAVTGEDYNRESKGDANAQ